MAHAVKGEAREWRSAVDALDLDHVRAELSRARQLARAWANTVAETRRPENAGAFAMRALLALAAKVAPDIVVGVGTVDFRVVLDDAAGELARSIGRTAAKLPKLEALHHVTSLYAALLPEHYRGKAGAFYTPPSLVNRLLDQAEEAGLDWSTAKVLDPAAGGGAFLVHAATRMLAALGACEPQLTIRQLKNRLHGLELDPCAAALAQVSLEIVLAEAIRAGGDGAPSFVRVCDTLEEPPKASFDLVVGNPPYGRVKLTDEARKRYARSLYGHANMYGVFTDLALRWTKRGGLIAYLTPTSFLAGQYYSALRGLLAKEAPPIAIDFVHARKGVFEDVLQETLLAVYRRGDQPARAQIHYLTVTSELAADVKRNGTVGLPSPASRPWLAPRSPEHAGLIAKVEAMPHRLADWGYTVSTGPLVWNRYKRQMRESPGKSVHPLVWAEAVTADGRFIYRADRRNHAPYFKIERGDEWLIVNEPCVLIQRTTSKEQARRLIATEMPAAFVDRHNGVVVENHLNMVRATSSKPKVSTAVIATVLNSGVVDQVFRCMSGSVAVSAFELEALPLPPPSSLKALAGLVAEKAKREEIEAELQRLYGGGPVSGLPPYVPRELVVERLPLIFPEGIDNRVYCTRELAASTVFAAIYIGAVEGAEGVLGPVHVYRMTDEQAAMTSDTDRLNYAAAIRAKRDVPGKRWYKDNTREPIRDETLRDGLVAVGAIIRREDMPTTSGLPRYVLKGEFAALFDPMLTSEGLTSAIAAYQTKHLSAAALARVSIMLSGAAASASTVSVTFPTASPETSRLARVPLSQKLLWRYLRPTSLRNRPCYG